MVLSPHLTAKNKEISAGRCGGGRGSGGASGQCPNKGENPKDAEEGHDGVAEQRQRRNECHLSWSLINRK